MRRRLAMPEAVQTIQLLVAPVVMVSACGLLCLTLNNSAVPEAE